MRTDKTGILTWNMKRILKVTEIVFTLNIANFILDT